MDDTNPAKEDVEYVESIQADVNWLIGGWAEKELGLKVGQASRLPSERVNASGENHPAAPTSSARAGGTPALLSAAWFRL